MMNEAERGQKIKDLLTKIELELAEIKAILRGEH
jgi:hypothetical protein